MRHGIDLQRQNIAGTGYPHSIIKFFHSDPCTAQLCRDGLQMLGGDVLDEDIAAGGSRRHHVAAGLDLVRDDAVGAAVQLFHTAHLDHIGAGTAHVGTAHVQEVGQVHHMGLLGAVFQNGLTLGHDRREHTVHGSAHADLIKEDMGTGQLLLGAHGDHAVIHAVLCAQCTEHLQVLVDGAGAQIAAAGHGHLCLAEAGEQCAKEVVAGAHLAGQIVRHIGSDQMPRIDLVGVAVEHLHLCTKGAQNLEADRHIADIGQIFDHADIRCQNGGRQNTHSRIFCAGNSNFSMQGLTAGNNKFLHFYDLLVKGLCHRPVKATESIPSRYLYCRGVQIHQHRGRFITILLYTTSTKKQSPICICFIIFCFAQITRGYSNNLLNFSSILTNTDPNFTLWRYHQT